MTSPSKLFDRIADALRRLVLDNDLNDEEGAALATVTDEVNEVRGKYTDRRIGEIKNAAKPRS